MSLVSRLTGGLIDAEARPVNRRFSDAAIAAAALVGTADGPIDFVKRSLLDQIVGSVDALKSLQVHVVVDLFNERVEQLDQDRAGAREELLATIGQVSGVTREAEVVTKIACAMGRQDGKYSPAAQLEIEAVSRALGIATPTEAPAQPCARGAGSNGRHVIALANQKGGTGKSTMAVHLAVALGQQGRTVGCIDLDATQGTLSHYLANRKARAEEESEAILLPEVVSLADSDSGKRDLAKKEEEASLKRAFESLAACDIVIIDTPGNASNLSRLGCRMADTLITPLNDSLLDVDVLARIDPRKRLVMGPSDYSQRIRSENEERAAAGRPTLDWIVLRNRLAQFDARNSREVSGLLAQLAERLGFRLVHGMSERVIFRELFLRGLTLLDLPYDGQNDRTSPSHRNARQELDDLVAAIGVPDPVARQAGRLAH